jgi:Xaa-Pro aminopeptidase
MPDLVIFADTVRSPELRHEVPISIGDPFVYIERNGTRAVFVGALEVPRLAELDGLEVHPYDEIGQDELVAAGLNWTEADPELVLRACRFAGVERAVVPRSFPVGIADYLRANGIELEPDPKLFEQRRRAKTPAEVDGMRRALAATYAAYDRVRDLLGSSERVTCEELQSEVSLVYARAGMSLPEGMILSHGPQTAVGHEEGSGPVEPGEPVVADLYPYDPESGCYSDSTRTFCVGEPPAELVEYHRLCREAIERVVPMIRPGVTGKALYEASAEIFEEKGYPTQRTKRPGEMLDHGYYHSLGHGVGLEVHERPLLGRNGEELVAGDVVTIEPGCYRPGFGGCRLEDMVLVTEDGCEVLTDYPDDLAV